MKPKICVIGAGVIGMTSAVCIQKDVPDAQVTIIADVFSPDTTSDGSAGFWMPFLVSPEEAQRVNEWGRTTYNYFRDLALSDKAYSVGTIMVSGYGFSVQDPPWKEYVLGYKPMTKEELKVFPGKRCGVFFTTVSVDIPKYLKFLMDGFQARGGTVRKHTVTSLHEFDGEYDLIVNCTGLGSRRLIGDQTVIPIRGQTLKVKAPWIKHFYFDLDPDGHDGDNYTYILTGPDVIVMGGTAQRGNWNTNLDPKDKDGILARCTTLVPSLKDGVIVKEWAGLRPSRPTVRLEVDVSGTYSSKVIHNYGHGGAGITIGWGCALETAQLAWQQIQSSSYKSKL